jgi:ubiquinone/menaquinone biosynthesis C-methylase UbiE
MTSFAPSDIASSFDARAATYNGNEWHRECAERLVSLCAIRPGQVVLDAGTGTGFAAIAASRVAGPDGRIIAVDLSSGMLDVGRQHVRQKDEASIEWVQGNAVALPAIETGSIDVVMCAAALLYMPVGQALAEWHRMIRPGGSVAFTSMAAGFPIPGRIFRECAAAFGVFLTDPSALLGSEDACRQALEEAGFTVTAVSRGSVAFSTNDIGLAWTSNVGSPAHAAVRAIGSDALARMRAAFEAAMRREEQSPPGRMARADVLVAIGQR